MFIRFLHERAHALSQSHIVAGRVMSMISVTLQHLASCQEVLRDSSHSQFRLLAHEVLEVDALERKLVLTADKVLVWLIPLSPCQLGVKIYSISLRAVLKNIADVHMTFSFGEVLGFHVLEPLFNFTRRFVPMSI